MKKNKLLIFGVLSGVLIVSIIVGIKYKLGRAGAVPDENGVKVTEEASNEKDEGIENSVYKKYAEFFTRDDRVTTIKIKNNEAVQFIDVSVERSACGTVNHNYMFFIPEIDSHLVSCGLLGGDYGGYYIVNNETGVTQEICSIPSISPEKNRLAAANNDLSLRFYYNGIQILKIVSGNYIKQFEQEFDWGPDNVRWLSNDAFVVDKYVFDLRTGEKLTGRVIFKLVDGKWKTYEEK